MAYIGLHEQIRRNNLFSTLLLTGFPLVVLAAVYAVIFFTHKTHIDVVNPLFIRTIPIVLIAVGIWFLIAWFANTSMIEMATSARPLERTENMRVYNLTENLCMTVGMKMPKLYVIDSPALNAFASGVSEKTFSVTLTTGIIDKLDDAELSGVIAHELTHIRNKDVRLLIISIIFVGILSFAVDLLFRNLLWGGGRRRSNDNDEGGGDKFAIIALIVAAVAYLLTILFRFALSRKREYLADAGAVQMTRDSRGLASALRKISGNDNVHTSSQDVKQLFISNSLSGGVGSLFATHPPIEKRIEVLEQM